jgi:nucleoid-associated protein YgaU
MAHVIPAACNHRDASGVAVQSAFIAGQPHLGGAMGIVTFVRDAGERIVANAKAAFQLSPGRSHAPETERSRQPSPGSEQGQSAGEAIATYIRAQGLDVQGLKVSFDAQAATVHVSGSVRDQATKEKVVLCCGNVAGVEKVEENLTVREQAPASRFHVVQKGETLSKIAQQVYGDANKYQTIFEANKPMLKDPDKIYPGQSLRIPPLN